MVDGHAPSRWHGEILGLPLVIPLQAQLGALPACHFSAPGCSGVVVCLFSISLFARVYLYIQIIYLGMVRHPSLASFPMATQDRGTESVRRISRWRGK